MALNPHVSAARRKGMVDTLTAPAASGKLRVYSGSQPADADATIGAAVMLAELTMGAPAFNSPASVASTIYTISANAITGTASAAATGTATWFRLWDSLGTTPLIDGTVGTATTDLIINSTAISAGAAVSASSLTLSLAV